MSKSKKSASKAKKPSVQDEVENLQITFYEIESWIEKTTPVLTRMTKELEKASVHFEKRKKPSLLIRAEQEKKKLEAQLQVLNQPQWSLSFQPGNLLRIDTNITSIEQLIDALKRLQEEEKKVPDIVEDVVQYHDWYSVEYWYNALGRRPKIRLDDYKHDHMNLTGLMKDVSPSVLNSIGQVFWDCLHPKFSSDWNTFWDRSGEVGRNQVCIDSGLSMVFIHVMRHHRDLCQNAQEIACFYYDRAREELMEYFDKPDVSTIEALLNLSMFCMLCKQYSQARNHIGLSLRMMLELGIHKKKKLPTDKVLRKKYLKLFLVLYYNDITSSVYSGEPSLIDDSECDIDFYEIITLNDTLVALNEQKEEKDRINFDNNKTIVKECYFAHVLELLRISKQTLKLIKQGTSVTQLLAQEKQLTTWFSRLPSDFLTKNNNYNHHRLLTMDALSLQGQASLLLLIQYETQWIILHKAVLTEDDRSRRICTESADRIVHASELITQCYGWCVCQQFLNCIYQASTIYCNNALTMHDEGVKDKSKRMIERIICMLKEGSMSYEGLPDDLTECLCEFLTEHNMHLNVDCPCNLKGKNVPVEIGGLP
ncbi:hypothetical protein BDB01DRAFT_814303 [Pilobolus umbonatus]|nr:hypothetical protein BDB01DRAFT_814303 [Pilobolus umbonatus]